MPPPLPTAPPGFEERVGTAGWSGWAFDAGAGWIFHGPLLDRCRTARTWGTDPARRRVRAGVAWAGEWTRRKENTSAIQTLPIANIPAILTAAGTAVAFATVYAAYALYDFLAPATAFILLDWWRWVRSPPRCCTAGAGRPRRVAAFATPILVSSEKPDFWALYIYLAVLPGGLRPGPDQAVRWLAVTTVAFALLWTLPCLTFDPPAVEPYAFHIMSGFVLAALLVVCGFCSARPPTKAGSSQSHRARSQPICSGRP